MTSAGNGARRTVEFKNKADCHGNLLSYFLLESCVLKLCLESVLTVLRPPNSMLAFNYLFSPKISRASVVVATSRPSSSASLTTRCTSISLVAGTPGEYSITSSRPVLT